jgi:O-antigen ligase
VSTIQNTFGGGAGNVDATNQRWRLAFWAYMLRSAAHHPLLGVGFGRPANFHWHNVVYDARRGDPRNDSDVTGPHNSFVNLLYRTGLLGFIPLLILVGLAASATVSSLRRENTPAIRAAHVGLVAIFVFVVVTAGLNVALEGPYMAIFFWSALGLLLTWPQLHATTADGSTGSKGSPR